MIRMELLKIRVQIGPTAAREMESCVISTAPNHLSGSRGVMPAASLASWHCSSPACIPTQQFGRVG